MTQSFPSPCDLLVLCGPYRSSTHKHQVQHLLISRLAQLIFTEITVLNQLGMHFQIAVNESDKICKAETEVYKGVPVEGHYSPKVC